MGFHSALVNVESQHLTAMPHKQHQGGSPVVDSRCLDRVYKDP